MTQGPDDDNEHTTPLPPDGWRAAAAAGPPLAAAAAVASSGPAAGLAAGPAAGMAAACRLAAAAAPPPQGWQPPPPGWQPPPGPYGYGYPPNPAAPYGIHPVTGMPYSDKSKVVAGVLQLVVPLGIGRFYMGDTNIGIAQLLVTLVTCGIGALWPFIDGILILVNDTATDAQGRPLRPS